MRNDGVILRGPDPECEDISGVFAEDVAERGEAFDEGSWGVTARRREQDTVAPLQA